MQIASPVARDPASSNTDALRGPNAQWASTLVAGVGPPDHGVYGKSPAQAGPAVADDLPSGMGGEASCAPDSPHWPCTDQSRAGSTPRITLIDQSYLVSEGADPA
jgi:hypothetical protein